MGAKYYEQEVKAKLKHRRALGTFLDRLITGHRAVEKVKLTYIFCSDGVLHNINLQFLQHDDYTDIITFDLSDGPKEIAGEIYISTERVAENATKYETTYDHELHRVIFHGALHLCGLRDKTSAEQEAMRAAEEKALKAWYKAWPDKKHR